MSIFQKNERLPIYLIFFTTFFVYALNISPSVYGGDAGDFLSAIVAKGVPHPSGYPLYTFLGVIFNSLSINATAAWKIGLLSALFASLGAVVAYLITLETTKNRLFSMLTAYTLAFSYTYWLYAEVVEVFSVHYFFILLLLYLTIKLLNTGEIKYIYLLAFSAGLSLTNNQVILLIFPVIGLITLIKSWKMLNLKILITSMLLFFISLIPYIYIPISSSQNPEVNWGRGSTLSNLIKIITRYDYNPSTPSINFSESNFFTNLKTYITHTNHYFTSIPLILSLFGAIYLIIKKKFSLLFLLSLSFLLFGPVFIYWSGISPLNFGSVGVIERFYAMSIILLILIVPFGFLLLQEFILKITGRNSIIYKLIPIVFIIIPLSYILSNYQKNNFRKVYIGDNFGYDIINTASSAKSILLVNDDSIAFNSTYIQLEYDIKKDLLIPGHNNGLKTVEKYLTPQSIEQYRTAYDRNRMDSKLMLSTIPPILEEGVNVYVDSPFTIEDEKYGIIKSMPWGLLYKVDFENNIDNLTHEEYLKQIQAIFSGYHLADIKRHEHLLSEDLIYAHIRRLYVRAYLNTSEYLFLKYSDKENSVKYYKKALDLDPTITQ